MRALRLSRPVSLSAVFVLVGAMFAPRAEASSMIVTVSHLSGVAEMRRADEEPWSPLAQGSALVQGDTVRTREDSRAELSLADGSKLRLGPTSMITLEHAHFARTARRVSVKVWVGRVWASVVKAVGRGRTFEVGTSNAIVGVRGTAFTVLASADLSAVIRVYAGSVGVRQASGSGSGSPQRDGPRRQVPGPKEIDKARWEEIVLAAMKQVKISSLGDISPAQDFEDQGEDLEWATWNRERDKGSKDQQDQRDSKDTRDKTKR